MQGSDPKPYVQGENIERDKARLAVIAVLIGLAAGIWALLTMYDWSRVF